MYCIACILIRKVNCAYPGGKGLPLLESLTHRFHGPCEWILPINKDVGVLLVPQTGETSCQRDQPHPHCRVENASGRVLWPCPSVLIPLYMDTPLLTEALGPGHSDLWGPLGNATTRLHRQVVRNQFQKAWKLSPGQAWWSSKWNSDNSFTVHWIH